MMTAGVRKLALTAHVVASVGWLGAVAAFLALAVAGLTSDHAQTVRGAYVGMELSTRFVIVPLCFASLITGVVSSLGTSWGLLRHYWVVLKLALTIVATVLLLVHTQPIRYVANAAMERTLASADLRDVRRQLVADAAGAVVILVVNTVLAVYKPRGLTKYGHRKEREERAVEDRQSCLS